MTTPSPLGVLPNHRRFVIIEARIKQRKITCFVDGGAERSIISRAIHKELKLDATPYKTTIMGVGGAATAVTEESDVPLRLGKKEKQVKALICDNVPIGDILLAADWLYEHAVTTTHRPPAVWFGGDKTTMIHAIVETPQLKATTTGTVDSVYLQRHAKLFSEPTALPPARRGVDYELRLSGRPEPSPEIAVKDPEAMAFIREQCDDLLKKGFIEARPSPKVPPAAAFVVFDKNSDSRGASTNPQGKPRVVYDYRKHNAVSELLPPLLPRILDVVRRVAGSRFFSKMDLRAGFHNLRMHPDSIESTAFYFPGLGTYVWKVLPFGIAGAPGAMEALMRHVLAKELENEGIEVYLDDILVHAKTKEKHDALLETVLRRLEGNDFHLKAAKCAIPCDEVDFLGYRIRGGKLPPDALERARDNRFRLAYDRQGLAALPWDGQFLSPPRPTPLGHHETRDQPLFKKGKRERNSRTPRGVQCGERSNKAKNKPRRLRPCKTSLLNHRRL